MMSKAERFVKASKTTNLFNAFISVSKEEEILSKAFESEARWKENRQLSALDGLLFAVKDNICVQGMPTTCGSKMLSSTLRVELIDFYPPYTATCVERLLNAGSILVGKSNMDEFGMGSFSRNSSFGCVSNPIDASKVSGGSSGGSAASVSANLVDL